MTEFADDELPLPSFVEVFGDGHPDMILVGPSPYAHAICRLVYVPLTRPSLPSLPLSSDRSPTTRPPPAAAWPISARAPAWAPGTSPRAGETLSPALPPLPCALHRI